MDLKSFEELRGEWDAVRTRLADQFGEEPDLQAILFLIGIQELGQGSRKFTKNEKQDLMHIATCRLLSTYGFYELQGQDEQGWPFWVLKNPLPLLTLKEQDILLKQAVIEYFREIT